ncbi:MAG TPA: Holliday junction resolvase RuvX, partial [Candidatus Cloacimonadota bacterium]|nr:Holliday junction resolvase RuvX [Candidatus Cloacimonadota bacterium]
MEPLNREGRILAIDYGEKRIGLALSDPLRIFAKPFRVLPNLGMEQF